MNQHLECLFRARGGKSAPDKSAVGNRRYAGKWKTAGGKQTVIGMLMVENTKCVFYGLGDLSARVVPCFTDDGSQ